VLVTVRTAGDDDLDAVAGLLAARRRQLAGWAPRWWRPAANADDLHRLWLGHLIGAEGPVVRVAVDDGGAVLGCAVTVPQVWGTLVDDVAVAAEDRWADAGTALLGAVRDRPARTCVPAADPPAAAAAVEAGMVQLSSYWVVPLEGGGGPAPPAPPAEVPSTLPAATPHTFGPPFDPSADGALVVADERGVVVGSRPIAAPPVFDPGGTVAVVDRLHGPDRETAVAAAVAAAGGRGDALLAVVAPVADGALATALATAGFDRVVDVYAWV
jgi:hypothetical protein